MERTNLDEVRIALRLLGLLDDVIDPDTQEWILAAIAAGAALDSIIHAYLIARIDVAELQRIRSAMPAGGPITPGTGTQPTGLPPNLRPIPPPPPRPRPGPRPMPAPPFVNPLPQLTARQREWIWQLAQDASLAAKSANTVYRSPNSVPALWAGSLVARIDPHDVRDLTAILSRMPTGVTTRQQLMSTPAGRKYIRDFLTEIIRQNVRHYGAIGLRGAGAALSHLARINMIGGPAQVSLLLDRESWNRIGNFEEADRIVSQLTHGRRVSDDERAYVHDYIVLNPGNTQWRSVGPVPLPALQDLEDPSQRRQRNDAAERIADALVDGYLARRRLAELTQETRRRMGHDVQEPGRLTMPNEFGFDFVPETWEILQREYGLLPGQRELTEKGFNVRGLPVPFDSVAAGLASIQPVNPRNVSAAETLRLQAFATAVNSTEGAQVLVPFQSEFGASVAKISKTRFDLVIDGIPGASFSTQARALSAAKKANIFLRFIVRKSSSVELTGLGDGLNKFVSDGAQPFNNFDPTLVIAS